MLDTLNIQSIYKAVSNQSGISEKALNLEGYIELIDDLEKELKKRLLGQDTVIEKICNDIRQKQIEWFALHKRCIDTLRFPVTSLRPRFTGLFLGESGTGKTEAVKIISEKLFSGNEITLRGQDVSSNTPHGTSAWVGAPPSYVGYGRGGILTNGIRKSRVSCINFDEIEKADTVAVLEVLIGLLGEAKVTDMNTGESLDASQCMVFATSNIRINNEKPSQEYIHGVLLEHVPPELISRFNSIYCFNPLTIDNKWELLNNLMQNYINSLDTKVDVNFSPDSEIHIKIKMGRMKTGARGVRDFFSSTIMPLIVNKKTQSITITIKDNRLVSIF